MGEEEVGDAFQFPGVNNSPFAHVKIKMTFFSDSKVGTGLSFVNMKSLHFFRPVSGKKQL